MYMYSVLCALIFATLFKQVLARYGLVHSGSSAAILGFPSSRVLTSPSNLAGLHFPFLFKLNLSREEFPQILRFMSMRSTRGRSPLGSPNGPTRSRYSRSRSPRQGSRPRSITRSPSPANKPDRRGRYSRSLSRSLSRGRTRSRSRGGRRYRSRSYSRSPSPIPSPPRSAKVSQPCYIYLLYQA